MIFNRQNQKLSDWYSSLPDAVKKELDNSDISNWNDIILNFITFQIKSARDATTKREEEREKIDSILMRNIVDFIFEREYVSTEDIMNKFSLDKNASDKILTSLSELDFINQSTSPSQMPKN